MSTSDPLSRPKSESLDELIARIGRLRAELASAQSILFQLSPQAAREDAQRSRLQQASVIPGTLPS